jgi:hypothetical protein
MNPWAFVYGAIALSARSKAGPHHQIHGREYQQAGEAAQVARSSQSNGGVPGREPTRTGRPRAASRSTSGDRSRRCRPAPESAVE